MSLELQSARADLDFMRGIVQPNPGSFALTGEVYVAGGLLYGAQLLFHWGEIGGWLRPSPGVTLAVVIGVTTLFLAALGWSLYRHRGQGAGSTATKAVGVAFQTMGMTNLVIVGIVGLVAWRQQSWETWLIYGAVVYALQGAAWAVAYTLMKRFWLGLVAAGWFATSLAMAAVTGDAATYVLISGLGLLLWMLIPGLVLVRQARTQD